MKTRIRKLTSVLLSLSLTAALTLPAAASEALGEELATGETRLHRQTQLSTNVFWSTAYSDLRTEHFITYEPNSRVTPMVTYGDVLTDRSSVADMAATLEAEGYRVVAGINGDFYNVSTGLPIGLVVTEGVLRSSDAGYYAIGFREDGTAILGRPGIRITAELGYAADDGFGVLTPITRTVTAVNKARTNSGIYLYTGDFNAKHTTGTTESGINVVCTLEDGGLTIGSTVTARIDRVEESSVTAIGENEIVLSANLQADSYYTDALRDMQPGTELTLSLTANEGWEDVEYAVGALYCLAENGTVTSGLAAGVNPRTAVGQKADGTLIFYTIDGRQSGHSIGASLTQVGERLVELGCETVLCLDGGGSTALAVTTPDSETADIINQPSEKNRKVTNQIFLVADNRPSGKLDHFHISTAGDYVLAGSTIQLAVSGVDTSYIPMDSAYELTASSGRLEQQQGHWLLTTPESGGEITVTARHRSAEGSRVIHAIQTPDSLTIRSGGSDLTSLTVTPGSSVDLSVQAVWNHMKLRSDGESIIWRFEGDCGTMDGSTFRAGAAGTGTITATAGERSVSIPVTVSTLPLKNLEDFEGSTSVFRGSGSGMDVSLNHQADTVAMGRGSLKLDYDLTVENSYGSGELTAEWRAARSTALGESYTALNLWVYGDGSGNTLNLLYGNGTKSHLTAAVTTLDFTGWKQVSIAGLEAHFVIEGLSITAPLLENTETGPVYADTTRTGTVYIDQLTASFPGTVDNEPPVVTASLDSENRIVTAQVRDEVDGVLPTDAVTVTYNGTVAEYTYDSETGTVTVTLPEPEETDGTGRVTVTARDASGNLGRASVNVDAQEQGHHFTDIDSYWGADYVDFLYSAGITTGFSDGTFRPNQNISRAQFAMMLYRYLGLEESVYADVELPFADLADIGDYAIPAVKALYSEGILNGTEKNGRIYFNPNSALTRAQAAAMIGRTQAKGYAQAALSFTDSAMIPAYAAYYIQAMVGQGVISGYQDGTFQPHSSITRGQMAKILYNLM